MGGYSSIPRSYIGIPQAYRSVYARSASVAHLFLQSVSFFHHSVLFREFNKSFRSSALHKQMILQPVFEFLRSTYWIQLSPTALHSSLKNFCGRFNPWTAPNLPQYTFLVSRSTDSQVIFYYLLGPYPIYINNSLLYITTIFSNSCIYWRKCTKFILQCTSLHNNVHIFLPVAPPTNIT